MKITWITHNIWIKVGALLLAVTLWFYVAGEERVESQLQLPIQLNLAADMVVTQQNIMELDVLVRGRKELVAKVGDISSVFDLTGYTEPQTIVLPIIRENIPIHSEITILKISPPQLRLKIDKLIEKVLPVRVVTTGTPALGYTLTGFALDPVAVLVKGPEKYFEDLKHIETEPVNITGRLKSFRKMVPLQSIPMIGKETPPQFVEVIVKIKPKKKD